MSKIYRLKQDKLDSSSIIHNSKKLSDILTNPIVIDDFLENFGNISGNSNKTITYDITKAGYKPIGIVGYSISAGSTNVYIARITSNTTADVSIRNVSSSTISNLGVRIYVLYLKE